MGCEGCPSEASLETQHVSMTKRLEIIVILDVLEKWEKLGEVGEITA